ncbi:MAG: hypothetical protein JKX81_13715, partial [Arenicella sp.]|nr:hypothetical protein [Arenicella sp.]
MKKQRHIWMTFIVGLGCLASWSAHADWFFRGSPNSWATTQLEFVSGTTYDTCQTFGSGDANGNPSFKIDRFGNWGENYPDANYQVNANTSYEISFDSASHAITANSVANCSGASGPAQNFNSLFFRGTANSWGTSEMTLVTDHTWEVEVNFDGQANQRFKLDLNGNWAQNYGDNNNDGVLDLAGADIHTTVNGAFMLQVNDVSLAYTLTPVTGCTSNCGGGSVDTLGAVYSSDSSTFSLWSP